jgi:hypothetical protein
MAAYTHAIGQLSVHAGRKSASAGTKAITSTARIHIQGVTRPPGRFSSDFVAYDTVIVLSPGARSQKQACCSASRPNN